MPPDAMPTPNRLLQTGLLLAAAGIALLYALLGEARPHTAWRWLDIAGEFGSALLAAGWTQLVLGSRPAGRVTALLGLGLGLVALGLWADGLDELWSMKAAPRIDKWIESGLLPLGMVLLTAGMLLWRREQRQLSEHMRLRERLFRDHRGFDRITQLAGTDYVCEQVALEQRRPAGELAALVMLEVTGLQALLHAQGRRETARALQSVTHQLLLNLRHDDLLCRYSGDRFVLLLPRTPATEAERMAGHLQRMVAWTRFHDRHGQPVPLQLQAATVAADGDPRALLSRLNQALEVSPPASPTAAAAAV